MQENHIYRRSGFGSDKELCTVVCKKVNYGQRSSQYIVNFCKLKTSEHFILPRSPAAHECVRSSYTDDLFSLAESREELEEIQEIIKDGLAKGGFDLEPFVCCGDHREEIVIGDDCEDDVDDDLDYDISLLPSKKFNRNVFNVISFGSTCCMVQNIHDNI